MRSWWYIPLKWHIWNKSTKPLLYDPHFHIILLLAWNLALLSTKFLLFSRTNLSMRKSPRTWLKKSFSANGRKSKSKIIFANGRKAFSPDLDEKICCAEWFWLRYSSIFSYFVFVAENVFEELHQSELLFLAENHFRQRRKRLLDSVWKEYQQFIIFVWASNEND